MGSPSRKSEEKASYSSVVRWETVTRSVAHLFSGDRTTLSPQIGTTPTNESEGLFRACEPFTIFNGRPPEPGIPPNVRGRILGRAVLSDRDRQ